MRTVLLALLATAACRGDISRDIDNRAPAPAPKPVETTPADRDTAIVPDDDHARVRDTDHEYVRVRSSFETSSRERLAKLDARINELEQSASESAHQTAAELRKDREELAVRLESAREQAKPAWDEFQSNVEDSFQRLEKRLDDAVH
ncbi:MAG TPA: hypothetical protein VMZ53_05735 [Kofleriaceae bacterium]|nr:hypothetical protein [Kofleriaceae bacterium]